MNGKPAKCFVHPSAPKPVLREPVIEEPHMHEFAPVDLQPSIPVPPELYQSEADAELVSVTDGLMVLIEKHGAARVIRLVKLLAALSGQEV